jgi:DNA-binding HxlR family transcriptional regulator
VAACWGAPLKGLKHATLLHRLEVSREALGRALASGLDQGWLMPNSGVGHPLRPEYLLSPAGLRIGPECARVLRVLEKLGATDLGLNKWSLPVLAAVASGYRRFSELRRVLPEATPRAISIALQDLADAGLLTREVRETFPPSSVYVPSLVGRRASAAARRLARTIGPRVSGAGPARGGAEPERELAKRSA